MDSETETSPAPLNYATPPVHRSFQDALSEFVSDEIAAGTLKPVRSRWRRAIWFFIAFTLLFGIAMCLWTLHPIE